MLENEPVLATFRGDPESGATRSLLQLIKTSYIPGLVVIHDPAAAATASVSICAGGTCYPPAHDPAELAAIMIKALPPAVSAADTRGHSDS